MMRPLSIFFFDRDRGMAFFLAFLVLTTIFVPMMDLSRVGRLALSFVFMVTLISGAFVTIQHRILRYLVVVLAVSTLATDLIAEFASRSSSALETTLRLTCLSILVFMTLK
jgi:hypothetical protein